MQTERRSPTAHLLRGPVPNRPRPAPVAARGLGPSDLPSVSWGNAETFPVRRFQRRGSRLTELLSRMETPSSYMPSCTQAAQFWGPELAGRGEAA